MHHMYRWLADDLHIGRAGLTNSWESDAINFESGTTIYVAEMLRSFFDGQESEYLIARTCIELIQRSRGAAVWARAQLEQAGVGPNRPTRFPSRRE